MIKIDSYSNIEKGIESILDIDSEDLKKHLLYLDSLARKGKMFDGDCFEEEVKKFILFQKSGEIDEIYVCHLGRHINPIYTLDPLPKILLNSSEFKAFFKRNGFTFDFHDGKLIIIQNGFPIPKDEILSNMSVNSDYYSLASRLGYLSEEDYCVNGFAFRAGIERECFGYYNSLMRGPEIMSCIDEIFGTEIQKQFREKSKYYASYIRTPIKNVIFDGLRLADDEKELQYLYFCLEYLKDYYLGYTKNLENPIIRFADNVSVNIEENELLVDDYIV